MHNVAIFASGFGSNADSICTYFKNHPGIRIACILCDRKDAGVFAVAEKHNIPSVYLSSSLLKTEGEFLKLLNDYAIDFIVLAGYLKKVPDGIVKAFDNKIINIHPALLPKFGGKGMYGKHVHNAVFHSGEKETGITIHYVNEHYDEGNIILQKKVSLDPGDSPHRIAEKVATLEKEWYPKLIEQLLS